MISHKYKCIFVHIPKTAGSSIENALFPLPRTRDQLYGFPNKYQTDGLQHLMAKHIKLELPSSTFNTYFKFTFVRNPWDKVVSQFFYVKTRPDLMAFLDLHLNANFKDYLNKILVKNHVHWEKQYKFIYDDSNNVLVDFIGRFEQLESDFQKVILNLGIDPSLFKLLHLNKTTRSHYSHYYDYESRQIVADRYKTDIEIFGYFFEFEDGRRLSQTNNGDTVVLNNIENQVSISKSLIKRASKLKRQFKLNEAIAIYKQAIELNPNYSWHYYNLGEALAKQGFWNEAVAQYQKAINFNPNCAYFMYTLGKLFAENRQVDLAIENLENALSFQPNRTIIYKSLIGVYAQKELFGKAIDSANKLINLLSKSSKLTVKYESLTGNHFSDGFDKLKKQAKIKEALGHFFRVVELEPTFFRSYHCIGECLSILQKLDEAIAAYQISLKLNPSFYWSYHCIGKILFRQGRDHEAINCFQQAIQIQPGVAVIHKNLGDVFVEKKDLDNAIECYKKALEINPNLLEAKSILDFLLEQKES